MDKGIFDRVLFFLGPESPLRSDRVMGGVTAIIGLVLLGTGQAWGPEQEAQLMGHWTQTLDALGQAVASLGGLVFWVGTLRAKRSARAFLIPLLLIPALSLGCAVKLYERPAHEEEPAKSVGVFEGFGSFCLEIPVPWRDRDLKLAWGEYSCVETEAEAPEPEASDQD